MWAKMSRCVICEDATPPEQLLSGRYCYDCVMADEAILQQENLLLDKEEVEFPSYDVLDWWHRRAGLMKEILSKYPECEPTVRVFMFYPSQEECQDWLFITSLNEILKATPGSFDRQILARWGFADSVYTFASRIRLPCFTTHDHYGNFWEIIQLQRNDPVLYEQLGGYDELYQKLCT